MSIVYDGTTFNNGGTAIADGMSLAEIRVDGTTVWRKEIALLDNASDWSLYTTSDPTYIATITDGELNVSAYYWTDGGRIAHAIRSLAPCDNVTKISFQYKNSVQQFAQIATYIGIVSRGNHFPYYGTGWNAGGSDRASNNNNVDDAFKIGSTRYVLFPTGYATGEAGGTAHGWTDYTFNFNSAVNLSNYYFIVSCAVQASQTSGTISASVGVRNLIAT